MQSDDFTKIPPIPIVVEGVVPCCWTHFANTWGQWICACPNCLDVLTNCSRSPFHITEVEIVPTRLAVAINMPSRDCHVNLSRLWNLHFGWEFFHTFLEVLRPLAGNVVCEDNAKEHYANEGGQDDEVHITVSKYHVISLGGDQKS